MIAVCRIRRQPHYRVDAFEAGLRNAGFDVRASGGPSNKLDWLIIWNRYGTFEAEADRWESQGGSVIVAENGYLGSDFEGRQRYAIAVGGHNGSGWFPSSAGGRLVRLSPPVKAAPWKSSGDYVLICGQRGIGSRTMRSPATWHFRAALTVERVYKMPAKIRAHPGNNAPATPLESDLERAAACAIWSSSSGVKALVAGVPVVYDAPHWIASAAASRLGEPFVRDDEKRIEGLRNVADGQWTVDEIAAGVPFAKIADAMC